MKTPGRRERDERRKFKDLGSLQRMGEALGFPAKGAFNYDDISDAEIKDDGSHLPKVRKPFDYDDVSDAEIQDPSTTSRLSGTLLPKDSAAIVKRKQR